MRSNDESAPRHCMVVHAYYPLKEPRVEREAQALVAAGYEVDVICLRNRDEAPTAIADGVRVYRLPVRRHRGAGRAVQFLEYLAFFLLASFRLARLQRHRRYSTVQIHNLPDFLIFAGWPARLQGASLILDIHDLMPEFYASSFGGSLDHTAIRLLRWQERLACRFADHVITVTDLWRDTLIRRGVPPEKVSVVMNVADTRIFKPVAQMNGQRPPDGRFTLIYHGTLVRRYGVDILVQAVSTLREKIPGLQLIIHGRGELLEELQSLVDELGLQEHVCFSDQYLPMEALPDLIRQGDLGIVPNRSDVFTDGILPTKLMEYVALGIPVVAARTTAITSYFDETMVRFFTPDDVDDLAAAILALYHDPQERAAYAQNAARFHEQYNWPAIAESYVGSLERLNGGGAG